MSAPPTGCTRRALLRTAAGAGAVLGPLALAGCSGGQEAGGDAAAGGAGAGSDAAPSTSVPAAEVPVGTAVVMQVLGDAVVLAQPVEGEFVAYSATCTHQGGIVAAEEGTVVACPLHGSRFDAADGAAPVNGPADEPLSAFPLTVEGDQLVLG